MGAMLLNTSEEPNEESLELKPLSFGGAFALRDVDKALKACHDKNFNTWNLATALWTGCSSSAIRQYLQRWPRTEVLQCLESQPMVHDHHILSYAIHRNDADCLRLLLEYGIDPCSRDFANVPALAFAIMRSAWSEDNYLETVEALLLAGADPCSVPKHMWVDYTKTPTTGTKTIPSQSSKEKPWCTPHFQFILSKSMNLSIRYSLWRANRLPIPKRREVQVAEAKKILPLFLVPCMIIGQELATRMIVRSIFAHVVMDKSTPLVLAFAGLSGHGKTELASQMGRLLSADLLDIDCTQQTSVHSMIGPTNQPISWLPERRTFKQFPC